MKASLLDYLRCATAIAVVGVLSIAVAVFAIHPVTARVLGAYYVIADFLLTLLVYGLLSAVLLRVMLRIHPITPGDYPMESPAFAYWMLLSVVYRLGQKTLLPFTPEFMRPVVASLYGARIGKDVAIGGTIDDPYLIELGDRVVIGNHALVSGSVINNGRITLGRVSIGAETTVGANAIVLPATEIGTRVLIASASVVIAGTKIPAGEMWRGNPARKWQ